jgi:hypothetical protein
MTRRLSLANNRDRVAGDPVLSVVPSEPWPPGSPVPSVAASVVAAVAAELPAHARDGARRRELAAAVLLMVEELDQLATRPAHDTPLAGSVALQAAYRAGRQEGRAGRSPDAVLAALRVGARVAWRELAARWCEEAAPRAVADAAGLLFAYVDELSTAMTEGHRDAAGDSADRRSRARVELGRLLLVGAEPSVLDEARRAASWSAPDGVVVVLLPMREVAVVVASIGAAAPPADVIVVTADLPHGDPDGETVALVVPAAGPAARRALTSLLRGRSAVVGPGRPWTETAASYERAVRVRRIPVAADVARAVDTEDHLAELVLSADRRLVGDLRSRVLAPFDGLAHDARSRLEQTLRSWLLHRGRRDAVAADLFVHPQTVRYRMAQVRELLGDVLDDPDSVLALTIAVGART